MAQMAVYQSFSANVQSLQKVLSTVLLIFVVSSTQSSIRKNVAKLLLLADTQTVATTLDALHGIPVMIRDNVRVVMIATMQ